GSGTPRTATWGLSVPTTGTYDVYARWAADAGNATNASYTVHYAGGTTAVPMNQTQNGGQWNLLGTFNLNPASNSKVELSDQANGRVVADAVMVVPSGVSTNHVTYTPTLTTSGTVDIYAKWTESATRAQAVTYTVQHAGGATDIQVNQQQPSAGWFLLGAFSMAPGQNHHVEVAGALEGVTVADAVRFVSAGTSAPGINYVHTDHLGSPQKMTDANQAIVWDAVYTPFGQVHSITGTATNNQRFPGQYADAETGYSYNYFRDYDPTTGRYVQSDPIGLLGGYNCYAYAFGNPVSRFDFYGLQPLLECTKEFLQPFFPDLDLDLIEVHPDSFVGDFVNEAGEAYAATIGNDIYFYSDQYNPYSVSGTGLIAHELAHAQQFADATGYGTFLLDYLNLYLVNGYENNPYEQEAKGYESLINSLLTLYGDNPPCKKGDPCKR
ncbi:MAG: RHS repeat-associated core domain-containing protein, partial [Nitrospirales bacterium]